MTKRIFIHLLLLMMTIGLLSACSSMFQGLAEKSYRDAMLDGKISYAEYLKKKEEIRQQSKSKN